MIPGREGGVMVAAVTKGRRVRCLNCRRVKGHKARSLCKGCYQDAAVRVRYDRLDDRQLSGRAFATPPDPPEPTAMLPGTAEKIEVMRTRFELGYHLHHPLDAGSARPDGWRTPGRGTVDGLPYRGRIPGDARRSAEGGKGE